MKLQDYMKLPYHKIINPITDESGSYFVATVLEFDGCMTTGDTEKEALTSINEAMEGWIETKLEAGFPVPQPLDVDKYSGKFVVRLPKSLHAKLAIEAEEEGVSLNQYALYKLSS